MRRVVFDIYHHHGRTLAECVSAFASMRGTVPQFDELAEAVSTQMPAGHGFNAAAHDRIAAAAHAIAAAAVPVAGNPHPRRAVVTTPAMRPRSVAFTTPGGVAITIAGTRGSDAIGVTVDFGRPSIIAAAHIISAVASHHDTAALISVVMDDGTVLGWGPFGQGVPLPTAAIEAA